MKQQQKEEEEISLLFSLSQKEKESNWSDSERGGREKKKRKDGPTVIISKPVYEDEDWSESDENIYFSVDDVESLLIASSLSPDRRSDVLGELSDPRHLSYADLVTVSMRINDLVSLENDHDTKLCVCHSVGTVCFFLRYFLFHLSLSPNFHNTKTHPLQNNSKTKEYDFMYQ